MESSENFEVNSKKKRGAQKQLRSDEVDDYEDEIQEADDGAFKKADNKTIANRRIVKGRRSNGNALVPENAPPEEHQEKAPATGPTFNFGSTASTEKKENGNADQKEKKEGETRVFGDFSWVSKNENTIEKKEGDSKSPFSFTTPLFSFSNFPNSNSSPIGGNSEDKEKTPSIFNFSFEPPKLSGEEVSPAFAQSPDSSKKEKPALPPAEPIKTGEEDEKQTFQTKAKLFVLDAVSSQWKERGVGNLRLNVSQDQKDARLLMRMDGSLKLILNTRIKPTLKIEKAGNKDLRFVATSMEKEELCTYLVRVARPEIAEELLKAVEEQKKLVSPSSNKEGSSEKEVPSESKEKEKNGSK